MVSLPQRILSWFLMAVGILCPSSRAQTVVSVDPADTRQVFEGWGTSLAWWAFSLGGWKDANLASLVDKVADTANGLGMTIFRYNIGGGDKPGHAHMRADAAMPGFRPTENGPYDWRADSLQLRTLRLLLDRVRHPVLEAFSNSPPWWMTKSGCAAGNTDGSNNLKEDYYDDFADYLTEVVRHLRDSLGLVFRTLEPFNEPNSDWWKAETRQEGCMFSRATQPRLIREVAASLKAKGLAETRIAAADANSIAEMVGNLQSYDSATLAVLDQVNTHSYNGSIADRRTLKNLAGKAGKRLWQSEAGPLSWPGGNQFDVAIWSASLITKDIREMGCAAWVDWQVAGGGIWGVIDYDARAQSSRMNKKGFAYSQYSRFIRPGSIILGSGDTNTVAAVNPSTGALVLVVVNPSTAAADYAFDLSRFTRLPGSARAYRTSASEDVKALGTIPVTGSKLAMNMPGRSVTTLVLDGATVGLISFPDGRAGRGLARGYPGLSVTPSFPIPAGTSNPAFVDATGRLLPPESPMADCGPDSRFPFKAH